MIKCLHCSRPMTYTGKADNGRDHVYWCEWCDTERVVAPAPTWPQWIKFWERRDPK